MHNLLKLNKDSQFVLANMGSLKINKYNDIEGGISNFRQIINQEHDNSYRKWYNYTLGNILLIRSLITEHPLFRRFDRREKSPWIKLEQTEISERHLGKVCAAHGTSGRTK